MKLWIALGSAATVALGAWAWAGDCGAKTAKAGATCDAAAYVSTDSCDAAKASKCEESYVSADATIADVAAQTKKLSTLTAALKAAGLDKTLGESGPFTVFAPTDDAFAKLPAGTVESLLKPENVGQLTAILAYHVVPGSVKAADVVKLTGAKTVNGQDVKVEVKDGQVYINNAKVIETDIAASNGVVHVIDTVLLPASK